MDKKFKHSFAIIIAKTLIKLLKLLKIGSGSNLPGRIARRISPGLLSLLANQAEKEIIAVTGTNGKTTTAGFIAKILETDGRKLVHNRHGANMLSGITVAAIEKSALNAKLSVQHCVFEIDEAYFPKTTDEFMADIILVTNLFRDQLDRYGELNTAAQKIEEAILKTAAKKPVKLILNADDPKVSFLTPKGVVPVSAEKIFYGFSIIQFANQSQTVISPQETINCPCGKKFDYEKTFYGHLGHFYCACGEKRTGPDIEASAIIDVESSLIKVKKTKSIPEELTVKLDMPGLYNAYNALGAISTALEVGIHPDVIKNALENYSTVFGRAESIEIKGKKVLIQLIKNPIGATEVLRTVKDDPHGRILIIINDNYADGRDVSWLWDASFELLTERNKMQQKQLIVSGTRAADMALRLKYAGIPAKNILIEENIKKALSYSIRNTLPEEKLYVLPTYTALLELQKIKL